MMKNNMYKILLFIILIFITTGSANMQTDSSASINSKIYNKDIELNDSILNEISRINNDAIKRFDSLKIMMDNIRKEKQSIDRSYKNIEKYTKKSMEYIGYTSSIFDSCAKSHNNIIHADTIRKEKDYSIEVIKKKKDK